MLSLLVSAWLMWAEPTRPIAMGTSLWTEELTSLEVRDRVREGYTTVLVGTGGVEENGPYVVTGKHNYVLKLVLPVVARKLGKTLIAPVVPFVPEGVVRKAGVISVKEATFEALLRDICESYAAVGFRDIVLVGDSGGNQAGMRRVAALWKGKTSRVHYIADYYDRDPWSFEFLKSKGIVQGPVAAASRNGIHDDVYFEAQLAALEPEWIRAEQRRKVGLLSLHGVKLEPIEKTAELGRQLAEYRAGITVEAIRKAMANGRR